MTLPVSLSLALYRGLATNILVELHLHLRLQREDFEDIFRDDELKMLRNDITHLMKAAGKAETAMDMKMSILQCLEFFFVGTDVARKPM